MTKRIGGTRRKTRQKLAKNVREKGKISITRYFTEYKVGDVVCLATEPAVHKSLYHGRFHGKTGVVSAKRGKCYEVRIVDINMPKTLVVHPVHMKRL